MPLFPDDSNWPPSLQSEQCMLGRCRVGAESGAIHLQLELLLRPQDISDKIPRKGLDVILSSEECRTLAKILTRSADMLELMKRGAN